MRNFLPTRSGLLLVLVASVALARGPYDRTLIRSLKVSDHPGYSTHTLYVAGQVATVLRFEKDVDPARTQLLGWEGRFEPLLVGSKKVVMVPIRDLDIEESLPLLVTLVDGTELAFLVKPKSREEWGWIDHQVNVFQDPDSFNAVLSSLYDSLKRERKLSEQNERFRKEENSVDHAYATLLLNGEVKKTPFRSRKVIRSKNEDMGMVVEVFSGPGKAAAVVTLKNTNYGGLWEFEGAHLAHDVTHSATRPFALRMDRSTIAPGRTGTIVVVVDESAFKSRDEQLADLILQIFRGDGLQQVAVVLEHTLVQQ
jgi:hypothetical protein